MAPDFPTKEEVDKTSLEQLAWWFRFSLATDDEQRKTLRRVTQRLKALRVLKDEVLDPKLSKKIGH